MPTRNAANLLAMAAADVGPKNSIRCIVVVGCYANEALPILTYRRQALLSRLDQTNRASLLSTHPPLRKHAAMPRLPPVNFDVTSRP